MSHMLCKECVDERRLNMKKLISLVMSIAMIFCVGTAPAFAVEMNDNPSKFLQIVQMILLALPHSIFR